MSGYCGILLALAAAAAGDEARVQPLPATATAVNEAGNTYREQSRQAIREVLARREFADLHADPYAFLRMISNWVERFVQRANDLLKGLPEWLFWTVLVWMLLTLAAILRALDLYAGHTPAGNVTLAEHAPQGPPHRRRTVGIEDLPRLLFSMIDGSCVCWC